MDLNLTEGITEFIAINSTSYTNNVLQIQNNNKFLLWHLEIYLPQQKIFLSEGQKIAY